MAHHTIQPDVGEGKLLVVEDVGNYMTILNKYINFVKIKISGVQDLINLDALEHPNQNQDIDLLLKAMTA